MRVTTPLTGATNLATPSKYRVCSSAACCSATCAWASARWRGPYRVQPQLLLNLWRESDLGGAAHALFPTPSPPLQTDYPFAGDPSWPSRWPLQFSAPAAAIHETGR